MPLWTWAVSGWSAPWPESCKAIMKRLFSALAVVLASLLVVGGDAVLSGGASAHAVSAQQAIPVTLASVPSPLSVPLVTPTRRGCPCWRAPLSPPRRRTPRQPRTPP